MSAIHGRMVMTLNVESHGMNKHSIDMYLLRLYRKGYSYAVIQSLVINYMKDEYSIPSESWFKEHEKLDTQ